MPFQKIKITRPFLAQNNIPIYHYDLMVHLRCCQGYLAFEVTPARVESINYNAGMHQSFK